MNHFVWADLSTCNPQASMAFYKRVFDWQFNESAGYHVAHRDSSEIVGLFEMPDVFQQMKMPHFWMSYIAVENALATAEAAREFESSKVEFTGSSLGGQIALIRDPQGAGFTVYDGGKLNSRKNQSGRLIWNELHVSDASNVVPFYESLFDWKFEKALSGNSFHITNSSGSRIADLTVISNELKGNYEYWICTFGVDDLIEAKHRIIESGGGVVHDEGERIMAHDDSGEAFFYIQSLGI